MNILLINHYAGSKYHGMEYRPYYMAKEWIKSGHNVIIIASSESHVRTKKPVIIEEMTEDNIDGINYIWLKTPPYQGNNIGRVKNMFAFIFQIKKYENYILSKHSPDAVIASSTYPFDIYPATSIAKKSKAKLIFEVHDLWPLSPIELGGYSPYHPFMMMLQWAENYAYKHADKVVSMLPKAREHMVSHGMAPDKFVYIPNGINIDEWESEKASIPDEHLQIITELKQKGNFLIGYAGAHGTANALHSLVDAAKLIKDKPISIILVGHGPEKEPLQQQANNLGLENIKFLPSINKSTIPHFLSLMDAVYIGLQKQSLFRFGVSPNKLMDYMMAAKPVIHAIEAGNDMVAESGCGISIPPEDPKALAEAMLKMSNLSNEERAAMGAKGKEYVLHNNDYRVLAKRFEEIMLK